MAGSTSRLEPRGKEETARNPDRGRQMKTSVVVTLTLLVALAALVSTGCSSSGTSPSDVVDWFLNAAWGGRADFAGGSYMGACIEWDSDDSIYALRGHGQDNSNEFWRYDISTDTWTQLAGGFNAYWSSTLAYTGGDHIYAIQGNGTDSFYRYSISGDSWESMNDYPETGVRRAGKALVWPGSGDYLYAIKGNETTVFARYSQSGNSWEYLAPIPDGVPYGGSICCGGGGRIYATAGDTSFYRYDIGTDAWTQVAPLPDEIDFGSSLCYDGEESLFMVRGDSTSAFWRYDIPDDAWESMEDTPTIVQSGGSLTSSGDAVYALPGGGSAEFWAFKP